MGALVPPVRRSLITGRSARLLTVIERLFRVMYGQKMAAPQCRELIISAVLWLKPGKKAGENWALTRPASVRRSSYQYGLCQVI